MKIQRVHAREVLDSRGQPTVEVEVTLKERRDRTGDRAFRSVDRRP